MALEKDFRQNNMKEFYSKLNRMAKMEKDQKLIKGVCVGQPDETGK